MSYSRPKDRRSSSRAFRPAFDPGLEDRILLTQSLRHYLGTNLALLRVTAKSAAKNVNNPPFLQDAPNFIRQFRRIQAAVVQTARGGQVADVTAVDGSRFRIQLGYISNTVATAAGDGLGGTYTQSTPTPAATVIQPSEFPQPQGTVRVYAMPGGKVGIIVDGTTANTELTINPLPSAIRKGYAHSFAYGQGGVTHILNIGQVTVTSGAIGSIEGFHTANLSGPVVALGTNTIDRIAFNSLQPGASITTGGSLNTLEVLQGVDLPTDTNISIGRDLNLFNVGGDINLQGGSQIIIGRDMAAVLQPPKGTGSGSNVLTLNVSTVGTTFTGTLPPNVSAYIQGSINIGPGSAFIIGRSVDQSMFVIGDITGASRIVIPSAQVTDPVIHLGTATG